MWVPGRPTCIHAEPLCAFCVALMRAGARVSRQWAGMTQQVQSFDLSRRRMTLIVNTRSGREDADARIDGIRQRLEPLVRAFELRRPLHGGDILRTAQAAVEEGSGIVAVLGGDGSQSAVAGALAGSGAVMAVLPGGTFNYFAREVGVETLDGALDAIEGGRVLTRDLGSINERIFINNASFGFYPHVLIQREEVYRSWGRSRIAAYWSILLALRNLNDPMRLTVTVNGEAREVVTTLAFVARSAFQLESLGLDGAEAVRTGQLALFIARGRTRHALIAAMVRLGLGHSVQGEDFELIVSDAMVIASGAARRLVALDGEKERMSAPYRVMVLRDALQVFAPAPPRDGGAGKDESE